MTTAYTLLLLFGVDVAAISGTEPDGKLVAPMPEPDYRVPGLSERGPRVALYKSYQASMDEGWTRWVLDVNKIKYTSVVDRDIRGGRLNDRFDVIIVPDQRAASITRGLGRNYPDSLQGGLGEEGARAIKEFVENGGTALFFNDATEYGIETLGLRSRTRWPGSGPPRPRAGVDPCGRGGSGAATRGHVHGAGVRHLVRGQSGVRDHRSCPGQGGAHLWELGEPAPVRLAPRRGQAGRQGGDGRRGGRTGARGALRLPAAVSRAEHGDDAAHLERDSSPRSATLIAVAAAGPGRHDGPVARPRLVR
ncbi:MAG: hypothetical protein R2882_04240 [Gemmatimonadales bacterium]